MAVLIQRFRQYSEIIIEIPGVPNPSFQSVIQLPSPINNVFSSTDALHRDIIRPIYYMVIFLFKPKFSLPFLKLPTDIKQDILHICSSSILAPQRPWYHDQQRFNILTQACGNRRALGYQQLQVFIQKQCYWKGTLRGLGFTEKRFNQFYYNMLAMPAGTDTTYRCSCLIPLVII